MKKCTFILWKEKGHDAFVFLFFFLLGIISYVAHLINLFFFWHQKEYIYFLNRSETLPPSSSTEKRKEKTLSVPLTLFQFLPKVILRFSSNPVRFILRSKTCSKSQPPSPFPFLQLLFKKFLYSLFSPTTTSKLSTKALTKPKATIFPLSSPSSETSPGTCKNMTGLVFVLARRTGGCDCDCGCGCDDDGSRRQYSTRLV